MRAEAAAGVSRSGKAPAAGFLCARACERIEKGTIRIAVQAAEKRIYEVQKRKRG